MEELTIEIGGAHGKGGAVVAGHHHRWPTDDLAGEVSNQMNIPIGGVFHRGPIRKAKAYQIRGVDAKASAERAEVLAPLKGGSAEMHAVEQEDWGRVFWPRNRIEHITSAEAEDATLALQCVFQGLGCGKHTVSSHCECAPREEPPCQRHSS